MNTPKLYHLACTVLDDITKASEEDLKQLLPAIEYLNQRRLESLGTANVIPARTVTVTMVEFRKTQDEAKDDLSPIEEYFKPKS